MFGRERKWGQQQAFLCFLLVFTTTNTAESTHFGPQPPTRSQRHEHDTAHMRIQRSTKHVGYVEVLDSRNEGPIVLISWPGNSCPIAVGGSLKKRIPKKLIFDNKITEASVVRAYEAYQCIHDGRIGRI